MPELFKAFAENDAPARPLEVLLRLLAATVLGYVVAWIYRRTRKTTEIVASFPTTLILLSVLIAMVTQVIGDNVARAFSLVGALSIVRFRTVVRDTQDTAYVIFAVVVGMAVGAQHPAVAVLGIVVVGVAAFAIRWRAGAVTVAPPPYRLSLRVGLGHDRDQLLGGILDQHLEAREVVSVSTARQGVSLDVAYETRLRRGVSPDSLVKALNRIEGVQGVEFERRGLERD